MIKNLLDLSRYDFKKFISQELKIYEKLDMIYFKIEVNKNGVFPKKRPRYLAVSDIDCICNSIYKDIYEFSQNYILPHKKELIDKFGEFTVGFFYLPVHFILINAYSSSRCNDYVLLPLLDSRTVLGRHNSQAPHHLE